MLTRRHLRIKVLQNLYAFYQSEEQSLIRGEKELFNSIQKIQELYFLLLLLPVELRHQAELRLEESKHKHLPTEEDLNPNLKFIQNPIIAKLAESSQLKAQVTKTKLSWLNDIELVKKIYNDIRQSELFAAYMSSTDTTFEQHRKFVINLFAQYIANNESIQSHLEEENVFWQDDLDLVAASVIKTIQQLKEDKEVQLMPLWKNKDEDTAFTKDLFTQCVLKRQQTDEWIKSKTDNWELERIASMDLILMNMGITESIIFPSIPVKVSLNEYIDLAKEYSTPRSGTFVNGILDKVFLDLKHKGVIQKTGRGLIG